MRVKYFKLILVGLYILVVGYYFAILYISRFIIGNEIDSITYHVPLSKNFSNLNYIKLDNIPLGLGYYPGVGEVLLSLVIGLSLPLGFYNIFLFIVLFFSLGSLFRSLSTNKNLSIIFSAVVCLLPTIVRLISNQKVDILVLILFSELLKSFIKLDRSNFAYLKVGLFTGFLTGTKYSGILYALSLFIVFWKEIRKNIDFKKILYLIMPILVIGFSWYLRNYLVKGNPFYPTTLFGFEGDPNFFYDKLTLSKAMFTIPGGLWAVIQSYVSEYLIFTISPLIIFGYLIYNKFIKKVSSKPLFWKLLFISLLNFLFLLPQPGGATFETAIQVVRFSYAAMVPAILGVFLIAEENKLHEPLAVIAVLSAASVLPLLNMYPKLIFLWLVVISAFLIIKRK
jgi:hypothetical protein